MIISYSQKFSEKCFIFCQITSTPKIKNRKTSILLPLRHNADINALDNSKTTPLLLATLQTEVEIVKTLLINGADPNIQDSEELITPIYYAYPETLKIFFDYAIDLDLNKMNFEGNTAFEDALKENDLETIKMIAHHLNF